MLITRLSSRSESRSESRSDSRSDSQHAPNTNAGTSSSAATQRTAVTIGNFDGVHRGHQALFAQLKQKAAALNLKTCAVCFEPHPREFFAKEQAPPRINSTRNKLRNLSTLGLDQIAVLRFDQTVANWTPEQFVQLLLIDQLNTQLLIVGDDFRFGKARAGDFAWLQSVAPQYGFSVENISTVTTPIASGQNQRVSSSLVRQSLGDGNFKLAHELLGRPYQIEGHVIHGQKLGRTLGFPTLNISVGPQRPALHGIYVVSIHGLGQKPLQGVASLGTRPAVQTNGRFLLEVFVFDWQGDAYGRLLSVEFHHKLRGELKYEGLEPLKAQIGQDVRDAREWFSNQTLNAVGAL
jgi:riboflavin kinase / FMN adenylyltransferase